MAKVKSTELLNFTLARQWQAAGAAAFSTCRGKKNLPEMEWLSRR